MPQNYSVLTSLALLAAELEGSEYHNYIAAAVNLAEERLTRDLDVMGLTTSEIINIDAGNAFVTRPSTARIIKHFYRITDAGRRVPLYLRTDEYIQDFWPIRTSTSAPMYYANWNSNNLLLGPTPTSSGTAELSYVARPTPLTSAADTNWFTNYAWNALYYATMIEVSKFMKNPTAVEMWEKYYQAEVQGLTRESKRTRRDDQQDNDGPSRENVFS